MVTELTQAVDEAEAEAIVDDIKAALKQGRMVGGTVLEELSREFGQPATFTSSPEADQIVSFYNMLDGSKSEAPLYMAKNILKRRFPKERWIPADKQGKKVFTIDKNEAPVQDEGKVKCDLHLDSPMRSFVESIGLGSKQCAKATLLNEYEKGQHMKYVHKRETQTINEYRESASQSKRDDIFAELLGKLVEAQTTAEPEAVKRSPGRPKKED
jgi:hypothetical protein